MTEDGAINADSLKPMPAGSPLNAEKLDEKNAIDDERVRDHLANERTYLAWLRTGVSMMGLGVVIAKLRYFVGAGNYNDTSGLVHASNIGLLFALVGIVMIILSVIFFLEIRKEIRDRRYRSKIHLPLVLAALTTALGLLILWYLTQPTFGPK